MLMVLKEQSLGLGTKTETEVYAGVWKGELGLAAWVSCRQGTNGAPPVAGTGTPRPALRLPFGCGKDNRSGLKTHFPTAHQLEPETEFLFL